MSAPSGHFIKWHIGSCFCMVMIYNKGVLKITALMQTHSITLGLNIGNEGKVTRQMWDAFVLDTVATQLEFCTIQDCQGIYRGTVEQSKIISVNTDNDEIVGTLLKVGEAYKKAFRQDAIMYTAVTLPQLVFT